MARLRILLIRLWGQPGLSTAAFAIAACYAVLYLWLTGDLAGGGSGVHVSFPAWARAFESRGALQFEPVGLIMLGPLTWTFSPLNTGLALLIGSLVGLNAAAAWLVWRLPRHCRLPGARVGLLASLPALLAGGACCAPLLLIWLGLPIAGAVVGIAPLLIPVSLILLLLGLWRLASIVTSRGREQTPGSGRPP